MIHRYMSLKWFFLGGVLKFVVLFDLNKLLYFFNIKLLGNLIESDKIAIPWIFFFCSLPFLLQNLDYIHNTYFYVCKFIFLCY